MKLLRYLGKLKRPNLLLIRRVRGHSMAPAIAANTIVFAVGILIAASEGDVVIVRRQNKEMIKRISKTDSLKGVFVLGDNAQASTDSRTFGWLLPDEVIAKVVWPRC